MPHTDRPPSSRQLRYMRALATATGTTFSIPATSRDASRQIDRMRGRPVSDPAERALDDHAVRGGEHPSMR